MELISIIKELRNATERLRISEKEIFKLGAEKAESERVYRIALSQEMMKLRYEKMPTTLLPDIARGNVAELKFKRDIAAERSKAGFAAMRALEVEISSLQSISKNFSDL